MQFFKCKGKNSSLQYISSNSQFQSSVHDLIFKPDYSKSTMEQNYYNIGSGGGGVLLFKCNIDHFPKWFMGLGDCLSYLLF